MHTNEILLNGYTAPQAFYDSVRHQVEKTLPALERDKSYTLEMLCGKAFWDQLGTGEPLMAGRCMKFMVEKHLLPLIPAGKTSANAKLYQLG